MGIMTGVLRVSKESLFSDLNNVIIYGIVDNVNKRVENGSSIYCESFGFTESETQNILSYYNYELTSRVKEMYDGYNFNGVSIYNPWSILNYIDNGEIVPYWVNTSSNELIFNLMAKTTDDVKVYIEKLLSKDEVIFRYNDKVTYLDYKNTNSLDNIMNLFLMSGYITVKQETSNPLSLMKKGVLPNEEVVLTLHNILGNLLSENAGIESVTIYEFTKATINNDKRVMEEKLNKILPNMSYMDETESFYHGYTLGLFSMFLEEGYNVKSNRESGFGRFDLMIESKDKTKGIIIELKITKESDMESIAQKALEQIETKEYYEILLNDNVKTIYKYAIIFKGKTCIVR